MSVERTVGFGCAVVLIFIVRLSVGTAANVINAVPSHFQPMATIGKKG
jgi:hypothetical protein